MPAYHVLPPTRLVCRLLLLLSLLGVAGAHADNVAPYPGTETHASRYPFNTLLKRLEQAIADQHMGLVAQASASQGAAARGVKIPGNAVLMVFRNDFAVRLLTASLPAGIEAPLRLYVTEDPGGTASVTYRRPSAVFAPYGNTDLDRLARELDPVFTKIVGQAVGP